MAASARLLIVLLCLLLSPQLLAKSIAIDVPLLNDEQLLTEDDALRLGFEQLALRLNANPEKAKAATIKQIKGAVSLYRYEKRDESAVLDIRFDKTASQHLLKSLDAVVPIVKKTLVTWVALMDNQHDLLLALEEYPALSDALDNINRDPHYTLLLPTLDLDDDESLSFSDLWQANQTAIQKASKPYHADGVLSIKLVKLNDKEWSSAWAVSTLSGESHFNLNGESLLAVMKKGQEKLSDWFSPRDKAALKKRVFYVKLFGLNDFSDSETVLTSFKNLNGVSHATIDGVTPKSVLYHLEGTLTLSALKRQIDSTKGFDFQASRDKQLLLYRYRYEA